MAEADTAATTEITVQIKKSSGDQQEVQVSPTATVADLKVKVAEKLEVPVEAQRLIFKGK